jgi:hypothetical protein
MSKLISLFDLNTLLFELYLHKHHVYLASSISENQKADEFSHTAFWKSMDHSPWKVSLFVGHGFSCEGNYKPHLKFYMKKVVLRIYRMLPRMFCFVGWIPDIGATEINRCFGAQYSVQRSMQHRYSSILVCFDRSVLYPVSCEIWKRVIEPGLENQGNSTKKFTAGNRKVSKKVNVFKGRPVHFISHPADFRLSNPRVSCNWSRLLHRWQSFQDVWNIFKR